MNIVFDIGGTNMRVAAVDGEKLGDIKKVPTPQDPKEGIATLVSLAKELAGGRNIDAVGGDIRGTIVDGVFQKDKRLPLWEGTSVADAISAALGVPVCIGHDTAVIGLGEVHYGAGRGSKICVYVTVSTGVGGDRIENGQIDTSTYNPEIGRGLVNGVELEDLVSGVAVKKKYGIEPKELESVEERNKLADILAEGLYNMVVHWSPDTIVLGGSMITGVNPIPIARVADSLEKLVLKTYPTSPAVKMAELGDNGGLYGGIILATTIQGSAQTR
jgi:predicted NBD/HSP70 family sugar kinase